MLNPLSPNIHVQILQTGLYTFPLRISWESLIKDQGIFSLVIIFLTLITFSLANVWMSLGENWCWSLLGLKRLRVWQMTSILVLCHGQSLLGLLSHLLTWLSHFVPCKSLSMSHQSHQSTPMDFKVPEASPSLLCWRPFHRDYVLIVFACYSSHCKIAQSIVFKLWPSFYCFMLFQYEVF